MKSRLGKQLNQHKHKTEFTLELSGGPESLTLSTQGISGSDGRLEFLQALRHSDPKRLFCWTPREWQSTHDHFEHASRILERLPSVLLQLGLLSIPFHVDCPRGFFFWLSLLIKVHLVEIQLLRIAFHRCSKVRIRHHR